MNNKDKQVKNDKKLILDSKESSNLQIEILLLLPSLISLISLITLNQFLLLKTMRKYKMKSLLLHN